MTPSLLSTLLAAPAIDNPPRRSGWDWAFTAVAATAVIIEGATHRGHPWPVAAVVVGVILAATLLWRRSHPLAVTSFAFAATAVLDIVLKAATGEVLEFYSYFFVLVLPYSLFRWASARHAAIGSAVALASLLKAISTDWTGFGEAFGGFVVLAIPAICGVEVRHFVTGRERKIADARAAERTLLARDLHDTVAHHVSAIAVRAQAGRIVGQSDPAASIEALQVIEREASTTLTEMRSIVGALRGSTDPEFAPQPGLAQIVDLADATTSPPVTVEIDPGVGAVSAAVGAALYRITQESVTNARRHAAAPTAITVSVTGTDDAVHLTVDDDGTAAAAPLAPSGFGLLGMSERAGLLGGSLTAGPRQVRGWRVDAMIPRSESR